MEIKAKELWEQIYGDNEYSFDFANKLIIKKEYKTDSLFSWDYERYDFDDEKSFIANRETIKLRDRKSIFEIDDIKYIITRNPNYSYSILSPTKISDENCPINFDLFLNNKITNYEEKDYSFVIITLQKMTQDIANIFNNYIVEYLKIFKDLISFDINNENYSRTEIKFQFLISEDLTVKKTLEIGLTLSSLMPLIIHRLSSLNIELWNDEIEDGKYYNIFVTSKKTNENYFELKNIGILGMLTTFENSIFIDNITKDRIIKEGVFENNFIRAKNSGIEGVYQYKFSRHDISEYNEVITSKKTK